MKILIRDAVSSDFDPISLISIAAYQEYANVRQAVHIRSSIIKMVDLMPC